MQAAVLRPQLKQLPERTRTRLIRCAATYEFDSRKFVFAESAEPDPRESDDFLPAFYKLPFVMSVV